jgi:hypothetical protein
MADTDRYCIIINSRLTLAVDATLCLVVIAGQSAGFAGVRATISDLDAFAAALDELRRARDALRAVSQAEIDEATAAAMARVEAADEAARERIESLGGDS